MQLDKDASVGKLGRREEKNHLGIKVRKGVSDYLPKRTVNYYSNHIVTDTVNTKLVHR